jgi:hypothetical protein
MVAERMLFVFKSSVILVLITCAEAGEMLAQKLRFHQVILQYYYRAFLHWSHHVLAQNNFVEKHVFVKQSHAFQLAVDSVSLWSSVQVMDVYVFIEAIVDIAKCAFWFISC